MKSIAVVLNYPLQEQIKVGHLDVLQTQFENMLKLFDEVHVISPRDTLPSYDLNNPRIIVHPVYSMIRYFSPYKEIMLLKKLIKKKNIKVIRALATTSGYVAIQAAGKKIPVIISMHSHNKFYDQFRKTSGFKKKLIARLEPQVYKKADLVPVASGFYGQRAKDIGVADDKIMLHYNFVDLEKFKPVKYELNKGKKVLLYVGRLGAEKGVKFILDAFSLIALTTPNVILKIVGEGEEREALEQQARDLGIADKVMFLGRVEHETHLPEIYQTSDVLVGSISAGFSLIEGMASGLPAVCGNVEWHGEVITDEVNGYLCDPFDSTDFAKAILKALDHENYYKLSINARQTAVDKFSLEDWKIRELRMYEGLLNAN
jgi:glycosyltransferase involved in cell wall biosynthesis